MFGLFQGRTPAIEGARSIAVMEKLQLGGLDQWVVIRGRDTQNPLLVYLHGGPGGSDYAPIRKWNPVLEEQFTIVHWCQRGANKSYQKGIPPESMTVDQFVADLHELVLHVTQRFGQRKVFLAGQSAGTVFGLLYAEQHPELVHAYIGINQIVDRDAEERISYEAALQAARERGNTRAVRELAELGAPVNGMYKIGVKGTFAQRKWLNMMGLVTYLPKRVMAWQKEMLFAPELTWGERLRIMKGVMWSMEVMWPELGRINFLANTPAIQVPVFLVAGRQDRITNLGLAEQLLAKLPAPRKELLALDQAGHIALFEQPERFNEFMVKVVRPVAETANQKAG
jgi:pimeloyl-ACP methyl ester carboxylesterase